MQFIGGCQAFFLQEGGKRQVSVARAVFWVFIVSSANLVGGDEVKMEGELGGKMSFCL